MSPERVVCGDGSSRFVKRRKLSTSTSKAVEDLSTPPEKMSLSAGSSESPEPIIQLTEVEEKLRQLLLDVSKYIQEKHSEEQNEGERIPVPPLVGETVLRFTGGWVRDRLLGIASHDIDVGISNMTGLQFGLQMEEYLSAPGVLDRYQSGAEAEGLGGLHKVAANPEKSKHLETVKTRIFNLDIDLVNLRKETYSEESRNPQMEFGTAEEDALRRDATINALFYNLNTSSLEDFTGRGMEDLALNIIRTPLEPFQTFKDDPLRVLRLIRFASRFGYEIEGESERYMSNMTIRETLRVKISRERVGIEIEKMLRGNNPLAALSLIRRLNLYFTVFSSPEDTNYSETELGSWMPICDLFHAVVSTNESSQDGEVLSTIRRLAVRTDEEEYNCWILAALLPWADAPNPPSKPGKKLAPPKIVLVAREGLKAPNKVTNVLASAVEHANEVIALKENILKQKEDSPQPISRDQLGMSLRRWGPNWRYCIISGLLLEVQRSRRNDIDLDAHVRAYASLLLLVERFDLLEVTSLKPIVDGKKLTAALDRQPGSWVKETLEVIIAWQLRNPGSTDEKEAVEAARYHLASAESTLE
ncbi:MAG: phosphatidylinositol-3,5-bisphosphate 5-phosphatase [Chaenotheca gracillima]|nr:MAG: phosphatidylinositol-3,5-bisphosphate 5-phosphatase [Chaenotheca gracillima]